MRSTVHKAVLQAIADVGQQPGPPKLSEETSVDPSLSMAIYDSSGKLVQRSGPFLVKEITGLGTQPGRKFELVTEGMARGPYVIVGGVNLAERSDAWNRMGLILASLWLPLTAVIWLVTWIAARATFRPLQSLTQQATEMSATRLSDRLAVGDDGEFGAFAKQLNGFLDRLEATVRREEQFASDAAHELRTPLTIIQGQMETALLKERGAPEYRETLSVALKEVERLSSLVEALLGSARATSVLSEPAELSTVLDQVEARWIDRFVAAKVNLEFECSDAMVLALPEEIECVLDNLLDNALRHSPAGSTCRVSGAADDGFLHMTVTDEGCGIPEQAMPHIFERLMRAEKSRTRGSGGFGIGLATCKRILESRGGRIEGKNRPEGGAEFSFWIPVDAGG